MIDDQLTPETGRSRLERTVPSRSRTAFVTNPDHDVANQHLDVWEVSQPKCALLKGSADHIRLPECIHKYAQRPVLYPLPSCQTTGK